ncbi:MAG: acyltransferase [Polaromonas sp.]|nr:acyltransferase [Polaromonas sp.]
MMSSTRTEGPQPGNAFRQDINALRAFAVLAVVGYHFHIPGFAGGFVGVDLFFVISGYLITGQVLSQLHEGRFSLREFWLSRLRRIYPALFAVTVFAVVLGWAFTLPGDYLKHIRQALSALAFVSNLTLDGERGYFDAAAQTKPLLHTWSLSIEWQFYLGLPLLLLAIWRLSPASHKLSAARGGLLFLAIASLAWCLWRNSMDPGSGFFSLRTRAWELLAGSVIASLHLQNSATQTTGLMGLRCRAAVAALGWLLIVISTVSSLPSEQWPGLLTLLPLSGAVLVVAARDRCVGHRIIGHQAVQRIGDWSYSIYLWHWPLWVFFLERSAFGDFSIEWPHKTGLLGITLVLGYLSYRYVEQPFRSRRGFWTARHLALGCALGFAAFFLFTAAVLKTHGFPNRLPDYQQRAELARRTNTPRDDCFRNAKSSKQAAERFCEFGAPAGRPAVPSAILWGDSLANQYLEPITRAASGIGLHGLIATQSGCRAFLDAPAQARGVPQSCHQFNLEVLEFIRAADQPGIVILGRNWGGGELGAREAAVLIDSLLSSGKTVVLILPSLFIGFDVTQRWMENQFRAARAIDEWRLEATPELVQEAVRREIADATAPFLKNPRFITVDPLPKVCEGPVCYLVRNGQANFRDTIHISNVNASQYDNIFVKALTDALRVSQPKADQKDD